MNCFLRPCTINDSNVLHELSIRTYYETFAHLNSKENMDAYLENAFNIDRLRKELLSPHSTFYFLHCDGQIAGYLKLNEAPSQTDINDISSLEIQRIYIASAFQGKSLGRFLMEQVIAIAAERKKRYIWLGVWEENEKAIRFYKRNGFYKFSTHSFVMGRDIQTDYIMKKDL